jgi:hypothetical protein
MTIRSITDHRRGIRLVFANTSIGMIGRVLRIPREDRPTQEEILTIVGGSNATH